MKITLFFFVFVFFTQWNSLAILTFYSQRTCSVLAATFPLASQVIQALSSHLSSITARANWDFTDVIGSGGVPSLPPNVVDRSTPHVFLPDIVVGTTDKSTVTLFNVVGDGKLLGTDTNDMVGDGMTPVFLLRYNIEGGGPTLLPKAEFKPDPLPNAIVDDNFPVKFSRAVINGPPTLLPDCGELPPLPNLVDNSLAHPTNLVRTTAVAVGSNLANAEDTSTPDTKDLEAGEGGNGIAKESPMSTTTIGLIAGGIAGRLATYPHAVLVK